MNIYAGIYILSIVSSIIGGWQVFKRYQNPSGFFFFLFSILASAWFFLYFLFFWGLHNPEILLSISRLAFGLSIVWVYSLLFFIVFFEPNKSPIFSLKTWVILGIYTILLGGIFFTNLIVGSLHYIIASNMYREVYWPLYPLYSLIDVASIPLFIFYSAQQLKKQTYLSRIRLKNILYFAFLLLAFGFIFQLILPYFGIWLFEKELVFFFVLFICSIVYTVQRYYFSSLGYGVGKIIVLMASIASSSLMLLGLEFFYEKITTLPYNYWGAEPSNNPVLGFILWILLFLAFRRIFRRLFLWETEKLALKNRIQKLERNVSYITRIKELNEYLHLEMKKIFKTSFSQVRIFDIWEEKKEIQKYFENKLTDKIFINDIVFIEEKKSKFQKDALLREIPPNAFIILPLFNKDGNRNIGVFIMGAKSFGDFYTIDEIDILREFAFFLELHVKFLWTYQQIQDLSVNLDRKVDEKTMEYNDLINKQKEFISIISHEIKSPLANAIFQADGMLDDLENGTLSLDDTKRELEILNAQLIKTGELTTRLFAVQYYDTRSVTLFREKIQISTLLETEYDVYSHLHKEVSFINEIDQHIGFIDIDRIQFQQVITNLLQNAVKFLDKEHSIIMVGAYKKDGQLHVTIEDNGKWFHGIDTKQLFQKYSTWWGGSGGLWMGLYLCKKIIEMHHGDIVASPSERFGWARFNITIPLY